MCTENTYVMSNRYALVRNTESLMEALPTMIAQLYYLVAFDATDDILLLASLCTSLFSLSFSAFVKSHYVYKLFEDKFDKTMFVSIIHTILEYIFRAFSLVILLVAMDNNIYRVLVVLITIILPEAILNYYHSIAYEKSLNLLENRSSWTQFLWIYGSNLIMGLYSSICFMYFYTFLQLSLHLIAYEFKRDDRELILYFLFD